ncbi:MAG: hypothetical protein HKN45_11275 [Flavobacteriales bacterium]|nr:hypothetical protein [Flavobacteriales bacterium]
MRFIYLNTLALLFIAISGSTQPVTFERYIGDTANNFSYSIDQTIDGAYIMAGYTISLGTADILLSENDNDQILLH